MKEAILDFVSLVASQHGLHGEWKVSPFQLYVYQLGDTELFVDLLEFRGKTLPEKHSLATELCKAAISRERLEKCHAS